MNWIAPIAVTAALAAPLAAQDTGSTQVASTASMEAEVALTPLEAWEAAPDRVFDAADAPLEAFLWRARPVVVFADSPADPRFDEQMGLLLARMGDLVERDVVIITDTDPAAQSALRTKLRPRGFQLTLIGKDGGVKLRKPLPWDARELSRVIDKMPMRQREMRERAGASASASE